MAPPTALAGPFAALLTLPPPLQPKGFRRLFCCPHFESSLPAQNLTSSYQGFRIIASGSIVLRAPRTDRVGAIRCNVLPFRRESCRASAAEMAFPHVVL